MSRHANREEPQSGSEANLLSSLLTLVYPSISVEISSAHQDLIPHPPRVLSWQDGVARKVGVALHCPPFALRSDLLFEDISPVAHGFRDAGILREADKVEVIRIGQIPLLYAGKNCEKRTSRT